MSPEALTTTHINMASNTSTYASKYGTITLLNRTNYATWKSDISAVLLAANALDIVRGASIAPANLANQAGQDWVKRRGIALNLLYMSTSPEIKNTLVMFLDDQNITAMWEHLATFDLSLDSVYTLKLVQEFNLESFKSTDMIESYSQRLLSYQLKLQSSDYPIPEPQMVLRLCLGMPDTYHWNLTRQTVLRDKCSFQEAVAQFQATERLRTNTVPNQGDPSPPSTANFAKDGTKPKGSRSGKGKGKRSSWNKKAKDRKTSDDTSDDESNRCFWCLRKGHMKRECRDFKTARNKARKGRESKARDTESAKLAENSSRVVEIESDISAYMAFNSNDSTDWILDSGASRHMCGDRTLFERIKRFAEPKLVKLANHTTILAYGKGLIQLRSSTDYTLSLDEAWYVPELDTVKLVSIICLNDQDIEVIFRPGRMVEAWKAGRAIFTGSIQSGLVCLDVEPFHQSMAYATTGSAEQSKAVTDCIPARTDHTDHTGVRKNSALSVNSKINLWHQRFGHVSPKAIEQLSEAVSGMDIAGNKELKLPGEQACTSCLAGRMHESFNKTTDNRATESLERIHADISGIRTTSLRGYKYFLLLVDDYTRHYWVYLLKSKETYESVTVFKQFKAMVERESGKKIKSYRADNGKGEFGPALQEELKLLGIQFEPSPPYKHSMNGVAEKAMQLVNQRARSMIFQAKLPEDWWDYAVEYAVYLKNRVLTAAVQGRTPMEAYTGRKPAVSKLRVFGCAAYPVNPKETHPKKYEPRFKDKDYILVSMSGSSIYRLLSLRDLKETMAADVAFDEYVFPASQMPGPAPQANLGPEPGELPGHMPGVIDPTVRVKGRLQSPEQHGAAQETIGQIQQGAVQLQGITVHKEFAGQAPGVRRQPAGQAPGTRATMESDRGSEQGPPLLTVSSVRPEGYQPELNHQTSGDAPSTIGLPGYSTGTAGPQSPGQSTGLQLNVEGLTDASQASNNENLSSGMPRRSQRAPKKKVFSDAVVYNTSVTELSGPVEPIESISLEEAM